nr:IS701 family transposase [Streptomyces sp. NBC_00140]
MRLGGRRVRASGLAGEPPGDGARAAQRGAAQEPVAAGGVRRAPQSRPAAGLLGEGGLGRRRASRPGPRLRGLRSGGRRCGADRGRDRRHQEGHQDRRGAAAVHRHGRPDRERPGQRAPVLRLPPGRTLVDRELYLGRVWASTTAEHERRCIEQGIPPERATAVATKPELARRMLERALDAGVPFTYFLADEAYGQCRTLRAWLEERQVPYVLAIPKNEVVPLPDGRTRQARELYALVPEETFERRSCADGSKGPREYDWASVQLAPTIEDFERNLLIRRSTMPSKKDKKTGELVREVAYFLCHTAPGTPLAELVTAAGQRWMVEEAFQAAKGQVGLDEHEVRKWCSWYRHTTVCMLAMAFLAAVRSRHIPAPPTSSLPRA